MFVHEAIEAQARETPDRAALSYEGNSLSYGDLNSRSNQLARHLRFLGVGPEVPVGICMERSPELVIAILGLLKAGGTYFPLDPAQPKERLSFILKDTKPAAILAQERFLRALPAHEAKEVCVDSDWDRIAEQSVEPLERVVDEGNLAFLIYTSGTTGQPKAVMTPHRKRVSMPSHEQSVYQLTSEDRHILKSSISFTLLIREVFWPLLTGAQLIISPPGSEQDSAYLAKFIAAHKITLVTLTPSLLSALLEQSSLSACEELRHVICFGEPLTPELKTRFFSRLSAELSVYYGATEAPSAMMLKCRREEPQQTVILGQPLPGVEVRILDQLLEPVALGACGELYVGGKLARGYFNRPDLTAERFIPDPMSQERGVRLYRTGDLGRLRPDGNVEFLGRADDQIKIRGFRIEPAEIDKVIRQHPAVHEAVLVAREDQPGSKRLVAYVVLAPKAATTVAELRKFLNERLPQYMVPAVFMLLNALPKTLNGKVDRRALPAPGRSRPEIDTPFVAPGTPLEEALAQIWKEVLCLDSIGVHDNFLDLGGHSLSASQIISRVIERFDLELPVQLLFDSPTVSDMAIVIANNQAKRLDGNALERVLAELDTLSEKQADEIVSQARKKR
jgi:amino acid adenylation domain-containing protein